MNLTCYYLQSGEFNVDNGKLKHCTLCPKKWTSQLMVITLSKPKRFLPREHMRGRSWES